MTVRIFAATAICSLLCTLALADTLDYSCKQCRSASNIIDVSNKQKIITDLQSVFTSRVGEGQIKDCSLVIQESFGEGFSASGGLCDVVRAGKTAQWMMCDDDGVGNFAAVTGARWWQDPKLFLAQFTDENCVGG